MKILPTILLVAAAANAGTALAPRGKTRRTVLFAVSLSTLLALLLPVLSALGETPVLPETLFGYETESAETDPTACVTDEAERALSAEISRRFGISPAAVLIRLPDGETDPGSIRVTLNKGDAGMKGKIAVWLTGESSAAVAVECEEDTE